MLNSRLLIAGDWSLFMGNNIFDNKFDAVDGLLDVTDRQFKVPPEPDGLDEPIECPICGEYVPLDEVQGGMCQNCWEERFGAMGDVLLKGKSFHRINSEEMFDYEFENEFDLDCEENRYLDY